LNSLTERLKAIAPNVALVLACHRPVSVERLADGSSQPPEWLQGKRVSAFCGVGNPAGFEATLASLGAQVVGLRRFPDHHLYDAADLSATMSEATQANAEAVVTTQKDAVKLGAMGRDALKDIKALKVALVIREGEEALREAVGHALRAKAGG
jgi:tetraacyldisaccharide 4'-kinase